jgi:hypothetical protein
MEVDSTPVLMSHNEVPLAGVVALYITKSERFQKTPCGFDVLTRDSYVEVAMPSGLAAKQCIRRPTSIDPDLHAGVLQSANQVSGRVGCHFVH